MSHKNYAFTEQTTQGADFSALDCMLDIDADAVFSLHPDDVRRLARDHRAAELMQRALHDAGDACTGEAFERRGFNGAHTDAMWAGKMRAINLAVKGGYALTHYDEDETQYSGVLAARIAAAVAKNAPATVPPAEPVDTRDSFTADDDLHTGDKEAPKLPDKDERESAAPVALHLPAIRPGQGQAARMLFGSAAFVIAPKKQPRRRWTENAMRVIDRVSGYKRGSITLQYYGEELRLEDILTWGKLLQLVADTPLGVPVAFNTRTFLRAMSGNTGTNSKKALHKILTRLKAGAFRVSASCPAFIKNCKQYFPDDPAIQMATDNVAMTFNLLGGFTESDDFFKFSVTIDPAVRAMFGDKISFFYDEAVLEALKGDYAKRLYLLYTSHADCYPLTLQEIREYFGSSMTKDKDLHKELRGALTQLEQCGFIEADWAFMPAPQRNNAEAYVVNKTRRHSAAAIAA